jgi:hypothetical protein
MKNIISIVLFSILILGYSSNVEDSQALSVKETPDFNDSKGIEMLETFYKEYFALVENSIDPSEIENFRVENCTKEFMKKIKKWKIDYDPFINAQDASAESVNSLIINRVSDREKTFSVSHTYPGSDIPKEIVLTLEIVDSKYKIAGIDI